MVVKSGLDFFHLKFSNTCKPARPIQPFWADFFHWAVATLKGLAEFQNKKNLDHFSPPFSSQNVNFKCRDFSPPIE